MDTDGTVVKGVYLDSHTKYFMNSLHKMKKSEVMTDVTLMLPDQSAIPCHKVVLMAACPYFETMFQSGLQDCTHQDAKVDFADADTIRTLVEFFYTGVIDVTDENVRQLTAASDFLCCEQLKVHLDEYIAGNIGSSTYIDLDEFTKMYNFLSLVATAFDSILLNFKEFASMSDFKTLTENELLEIVSNDRLNVENEDIVFDAVVHWVDADPELRKEAFSRIAPFIRFPFCTPMTLTSDVCRNRLMLSSGCINLAHEALNSPFHCTSHHSIHNARCVPRDAFKGVRKERLIRMVQDRTNFNEIRISVATVASGRIGEWENILRNVRPMSWLKKVAVSPSGINCVFQNNECNCLIDLKTKKVVETPWNEANEGSAFVIVDKQLFAFGGYVDTAHTALKTVESFNTDEVNPKWKLELEMLHELVKPRVVRFGNKVYVFCGFDKNGPSRVTQEFDLVRSQWRMRSEMPGPCKYGGVVALNDKIYVVGGDEQVCYSYEPSKDVWKVLSQPTEFYDMFTTVTACNGKILLGNKLSVEEYDPTEDTWSFQDHVLPREPDIHRMVLHTVCL